MWRYNMYSGELVLFFMKQRTAYEVGSCLLESENCIGGMGSGWWMMGDG